MKAGSFPAWPQLSPVVPRLSPGESRQRPGRTPVYSYTAGTHRGYTGIRLRQSYGNAPVSPRSSPVTPRRSPAECRWRPGRAPVNSCTVAIPGLLRHSPGLHRGVAVDLPGSVRAPVELLCRPGCSRCRHGCSRCRAGCCRSFPVTPGSSRRY
ncbi:hypothetical protein DPMN_021233 [Dreissena polymorpha]|uniref:Uncharacterized protein n=1 Tax=Dreissena polymorpha TaxID=45954 RepID=A0A9D4NNS7_DREPO|nr:hypothetical protein DPMN_021233 [Dreissena polymorpha]